LSLKRDECSNPSGQERVKWGRRGNEDRQGGPHKRREDLHNQSYQYSTKKRSLSVNKRLMKRSSKQRSGSKSGEKEEG